MKLMTDTISGVGAEGAADDDDFMPMMQGMMKNLLSKDILYPSLKDISTKVDFSCFYMFILIIGNILTNVSCTRN